MKVTRDARVSNVINSLHNVRVIQLDVDLVKI